MNKIKLFTGHNLIVFPYFRLVYPNLNELTLPPHKNSKSSIKYRASQESSTFKKFQSTMKSMIFDYPLCTYHLLHNKNRKSKGVFLQFLKTSNDNSENSDWKIRKAKLYYISSNNPAILDPPRLASKETGAEEKGKSRESFPRFHPLLQGYQALFVHGRRSPFKVDRGPSTPTTVE